MLICFPRFLSLSRDHSTCLKLADVYIPTVNPAMNAAPRQDIWRFLGLSTGHSNKPDMRLQMKLFLLTPPSMLSRTIMINLCYHLQCNLLYVGCKVWFCLFTLCFYQFYGAVDIKGRSWFDSLVGKSKVGLSSTRIWCFFLPSGMVFKIFKIQNELKNLSN